ncbi:MAG TPA: hypothetical protein VGS20_07480 [Candidatus Acidoferrales bacterium]|nr:hypothetical protein [Candidatus Acidoferrales bacterium]
MILLGKIGAGLLGGALVVGGLASSQGFLHVRIDEKRPDGTHLRLLLPAVALPVVLECVPRKHLRQAASDLRPWLPAIEAAASGLVDVPDGPLVEVAEPGERVSVVKSDRSLVVDVNDPGEAVHVSVPLGAVRSAASVVATRAGSN